ncbi:MAG: hypothetical protein IJ683_05020 [Butyrivibrio sp.]|nr:hypothetical protein [Butyrivibrio sp.]MBR1641669.1 hypothetical protein [Butyrivibrio sp.]
MKKNLFRKEAINSISSPDQLADYLRVTTPGTWIVLSAVLFFLIGLFAWSTVGTLENSVNARALVESNTATVISIDDDLEDVKSGMELEIAGRKFIITSVDKDEYGRIYCYSQVEIPDGVYDVRIVTEEIHPISFFIGNRFN